MTVTATIVSILLAVLVAFSAIRKVSHREEVVQTYTRVGVPEDKLNYLAIILLTGSGGLLVGLLWAPIGVAAAIGLVCYFVAAVGFHIRADDLGNLPTPVAFEVIAVVALATRLAAT